MIARNLRNWLEKQELESNIDFFLENCNNGDYVDDDNGNSYINTSNDNNDTMIVIIITCINDKDNNNRVDNNDNHKGDDNGNNNNNVDKKNRVTIGRINKYVYNNQLQLKHFIL